MKRIAALSLVCLMVSLFAVEPSRAVENVRVAYPSMGTSVFCLIIAQKEGYLKEEGLDAQLLSIRGEIAIRTTLAGEVDFFTNAGSALAAAVRGVPVKLVTVFQDRPSWDLIAQPDIKSVAQLRGKNIAVMSPEGSLAVVAREILRKNGIDPTNTLQHRDEPQGAKGGVYQAGYGGRLRESHRRRIGHVKRSNQTKPRKDVPLHPRCPERPKFLRGQTGAVDQIYDGGLKDERSGTGQCHIRRPIEACPARRVHQRQGFRVDDRGDEKDHQSATRHQNQRHLRFDLREKSQRRTQKQRLETVTAPRSLSLLNGSKRLFSGAYTLLLQR